MMKSNPLVLFIVLAFLLAGVLCFNTYVLLYRKRPAPASTEIQNIKDSLYKVNMLRLKLENKELQDKVFMLRSRVDSVQKLKQKTRTVYEKKIDAVAHWNTDSTAEFWTNYFAR